MAEEDALRGSEKTKKTSAAAPAGGPLEPNAAGVDIGATQIYVAVPPERDERPVRRFETFTGDLMAAADWLQRCGIPGSRNKRRKTANALNNVSNNKQNIWDFIWLLSQPLRPRPLMGGPWEPDIRLGELKGTVRPYGGGTY